MPTGNGPLPTNPWYASDETISIHAMGDFATLCPQWQVLASGVDGVFAAGAPWVLTSASVNFQAQGVAAQNVVVLTAPKANFPGGGHLFAVDAVSGTSVTLRRVGQPLNFGQPPAPSGGLTAVAFSIPTLGPQIDESTYRLKDRFALDESIFYRSSGWVYQGVEDLYRVFRDATVFSVLADCYESQMRDQTENGDFARKARRYKQRLEEAIVRLQVRWGPYGSSQQPSTITGCKLSR